MAFLPVKRDSFTTSPIEQSATTGSETYVMGEALVFSSGALTKCGATATPDRIGIQAYVAPASGQLPIANLRVLEDIEWETTFAADGSSINVGDLVTIHSDGAQVTATTSSGVFQVTKKLGSGASGTAVRGMFRR